MKKIPYLIIGSLLVPQVGFSQGNDKKADKEKPNRPALERVEKQREAAEDRAKEALLSPAEAAASAAGVAVESIVRHGNPAEMLADIAEEAGVIQMYVGRTGGSKTQRLLFGSVASSLIQISTVPVTVVP